MEARSLEFGGAVADDEFGVEDFVVFSGVLAGDEVVEEVDRVGGHFLEGLADGGDRGV